MSPAHSTQVPYAPAATPATRQGEGFSTPHSAGASPMKGVNREQHGSPLVPKVPLSNVAADRSVPELGSPEQTGL